MMNISFDPSGRPTTSLFGRIVGIVVGIVALGATLFFSAIVFVVLAIVGLALWGFFWWKTRVLRRDLKAQMERMQTGPGFESYRQGASQDDGQIIDGESVRVDEDHR